MRYREVFEFIRERHRIYLKKQAGKPKPWTTDPILQRYRFCCSYRELDKVTVWVRENWRDPHATVPHLWFAMVVARLVNWPNTLGEIGFPVPWKPAHFLKVMHGRRARGEQVFSGAYIVSTNGHKMDKAEYLAQHVLGPLWAARGTVLPRQGETLQAFFDRLYQFNGLAGFMAAQVVADVKQTMPLRAASDWWTFAASGPGSRRGLNRIMGRPTDAPWREAEWHATLLQLQTKLAPLLQRAAMPRMCAQDTQNIGGCEFDKRERVRLGEGRPRSTYPGAA